MVRWASDDEKIRRWSFYAKDESWQGMIYEHEDDFSWWVMVPAEGTGALSAEGDAQSREQAEHLAKAVACVLMAVKDPKRVPDATAAVIALAAATSLVEGSET